MAQLEEEKKHLEYMNSIKKYDDQQVTLNNMQRKPTHLNFFFTYLPNLFCPYDVQQIIYQANYLANFYLNKQLLS